MTRLLKLFCFCVWLCSASVFATEPAPVDPVLLGPLPDGLAIHARILNPDRMEGHPLVQRLVRLVETSEEWQRLNDETTGLIQFREAFGFVDRQMQVLGVDGGVRSLWTRGMVLLVGEGDRPSAGGVFLARDAAAAQVFSGVLQQWAETQLGLKYEPAEIDGTAVLAAGDLHVAIVEHRVLWANKADAMRHVLRHVKAAASGSEPPADPTLMAGLQVSLAAVRKNPDFAKGLENPASDFGLLTFLGGWTDLLRRHERLTVGLHSGEGETVSLKVGFRDAKSERPEALAPFWAHGEEQIAPPLHPPGTIQSFSWYRDYASLWKNRRELASAETIDRVDKADDDSGKQLAVFGTNFKPSELILQLGPHFRVVTLEQERVPYDIVDVENVLPAAAFLVDLRDEDKFRKMVDPFVNLLGLIQGGEQRVLTVREDYKGAKTVSFVYQETDQEIRQRARDQYNFRFTGSITRGHFIIGTTPKVVQAVIDELDRPQDSFPDPGAYTERQSFSFPALARQLGRMQASALRRIVLDTGWTIEKAEQEYQLALALLAALGDARVQLGDDSDGFGIEFILGESASAQVASEGPP